MSNEITVNLEWETNENGMYFTTVFGTVKKTWEQIVGPIFGFEIKDNGWAKGEKAMHFAETFAVQNYDKRETLTNLTVNAAGVGTVNVTASEGRVQVWIDSDERRGGYETLGLVTFSDIVGG